MKSIIFTITLLFTIQSFSSLNNKCFTQYESTTPIFKEAYENSRILGWGLTTHQDFRPLEMLSQFIDEVGNDEDLKYIFVEFPSVGKEIFEHISLYGNAARKDTVPTLASYSPALLSPYKIENNQLRAEFLLIYKKVFKLNKTRENKLIIVPIDSLFGFNGEAIHHPLSYDREKNTAENFNDHLSSMKKSEKAIALYHSYHLAKNIYGNTYWSEENRFHHSQVSFMGISNLDDDQFKLITFDSPFQELEESERLFKTQNTPATKEVLALKVKPTAKSSECLNSVNYYNRYVRDAAFPNLLSDSFQYVIYLD